MCVIWLVVSTPLKNMKVCWDIYGKIIQIFQTTNQIEVAIIAIPQKDAKSIQKCQTRLVVTSMMGSSGGLPPPWRKTKRQTQGSPAPAQRASRALQPTASGFNAGRITKIRGKNGWKTLTRNWKPTYRNKKDILYQVQGVQVRNRKVDLVKDWVYGGDGQ